VTGRRGRRATAGSTPSREEKHGTDDTDASRGHVLTRLPLCPKPAAPTRCRPALAAAERGLGFIRLDDDGQPYETSVTAHSILHWFFDVGSTTSLPDEISQWLARDRGRTSPAELLLYRSDGRRLVIHRPPAPSGDLLLLSEQPVRPPETRRLGLTAREAEVLSRRPAPHGGGRAPRLTALAYLEPVVVRVAPGPGR
jgi:hypothetical protein